MDAQMLSVHSESIQLGVIKLHAQRCIIICTSTSEASVFELVLQAFMQKQCCELALR